MQLWSLREANEASGCLLGGIDQSPEQKSKHATKELKMRTKKPERRKHRNRERKRKNWQTNLHGMFGNQVHVHAGAAMSNQGHCEQRLSMTRE